MIMEELSSIRQYHQHPPCYCVCVAGEESGDLSQEPWLRSTSVLVFPLAIHQLSYPVLWHEKSSWASDLQSTLWSTFFHPGLSLILLTIHCGRQREKVRSEVWSSLLFIRNASEVGRLISSVLHWAIHHHLYWQGAGEDHRGPRW